MVTTTHPPKEYPVAPQSGMPLLILWAILLAATVLPLAFMNHATAALGVLLFGAATFAIVPPLQIRVMQAASEAPGLASSINVGAFNLGNAVGAALGGAVISSGLGYAAIPVAGGLLAASGLLLAWLGRPRTAVAEAC